MNTTSGRKAAVITYDNHLMTERPASPLRRVLEAPFTRRAWAELGHTLVSFPLAVAAFTFIVPMLVNGLLWALSAASRKLGAAPASSPATLLGEDIPAPPPYGPC